MNTNQPGFRVRDCTTILFVALAFAFAAHADRGLQSFAMAEELQQIKGIGVKRAQLIIKHRPYRTVDDLRAHKRIPERILKENENRLTVSRPASSIRPPDCSRPR